MSRARQWLRFALTLVPALAMLSRGDMLILDAVSGAGVTSGWTAGGATVGDDASAPNGTASTYTGKSPNRRLFVPIADVSIDTSLRVIYSVKVRVRARSSVDLAGTYDGLKVGVNVGGTDYLDPAIDEQDTIYLYYEHTWQRNPATAAAWRWANIASILGGCITAKTARSQVTTYSVDHVQIIVEYGTDTTNVAPTASNLAIAGRDTVGEVLTGSYAYADSDSDPEGLTQFAWYRADDAAGTNMAAISGATGTTCVVPPVAETRYVFFEVTPIALTGVTMGSPVLSQAFGPIRAATGTAPVASNVTVTGQTMVWQTLTGAYTYSDAENDTEGATLLRWLRDGVAIPGAESSTYTLMPEDAGATITFEVTPVALSGTPRGGTAAESAPVGPIEPAVSVATVSARPRPGLPGRAFASDLRGRSVSLPQGAGLPPGVYVVRMQGNAQGNGALMLVR